VGYGGFTNQAIFKSLKNISDEAEHTVGLIIKIYQVVRISIQKWSLFIVFLSFYICHKGFELDPWDPNLFLGSEPMFDLWAYSCPALIIFSNPHLSINSVSAFRFRVFDVNHSAEGTGIGSPFSKVAYSFRFTFRNSLSNGIRLTVWPDLWLTDRCRINLAIFEAPLVTRFVLTGLILLHRLSFCLIVRKCNYWCEKSVFYSI